MNGQELRDVIARLDETQVGLARFLGYNDSTIRKWIADRNRVPIPVEMLLRLMIKHRLTPDNVVALVKRK
jgi:DNA-binding transcriptional regulator YiaG